ncbi:MAG: alpha/beta hydrolase [Silvanigrellaceae bacterium]|nr:alpha/beta hydrolase [Silvanigrellaceae bacterium]
MVTFASKYSLLHYEVMGSGKPLLMINGYTDSMQDWDIHFIEQLAEKNQLIFIDYWGTGNSNISNITFATFTYLVEDISLLLKHLDIEKTSLVGRSMGGYLVQEFCDNFFYLVDKIILICTSAGGKNRFYSNNPMVMADLRSLSTLSETQKFQKMHELIFPGNTFSISEEEFNNRKVKLSKDQQIKVSLETEKLQLEATNMWFEKVNKSSLTINCPALIISGDQDYITPQENSEILHKKIPHSILKIIQNTGHGLVTQQPLLIAEEINKFLN